MTKDFKKYLVKNNINIGEYIVEKGTCDNITLKHKVSGKTIYIRW